MRRLRRIWTGEAGYSLPELLAAMSILAIVMGTLTTVFVSGLTAQQGADARIAAQQTARVAVDRLRDEIHCASSISAGVGAVATITLSLPPNCPSPETSVSYSTVSVTAGRFRLQRAGVAIADHLTTGAIFTYLAPSSAELARVHVDLPVNTNPAAGRPDWNLVDDIVLRNSRRTT